MSLPPARSEIDAEEGLVPDRPTLPLLMSSAQHKTLTQFCRFREQGFNGRWLSRESLLLILYTAFAFAVLLLYLTAFAPAGYLFLGLVLGAQLRQVENLRVFRRIWPV